MNDEQRERERLKRLRESQIASRHPGDSKIRHFDWSIATRKPTRKQKTLLTELFEILPARWKGAIAGVVLGGVIALFLVLLVLPDEWDILGLLPVLVCGIVGMVIGKVLQEEPIR